jgi:ferredoxin
MKAKVDPEKCIGCGLCENTSPEVFRMQDDKAVVYVAVIPPQAETACKQAADECPVAAIALE